MDSIPINKYALTVAEAAAVIGVSSCKVYQMIHDKKLYAQKAGHTRRVPVDAISHHMHRQ